MKIPLFRKSEREAAEGYKKSGTEPMKYSTYSFYLNRLGANLGFEDRLTSYALRRGTANAILGVAPDPVVDQVMRHNPMTGCLANAYLNSRIGFNVQDAFLERDPSADGLTRAFTHMGIRCDQEVPRVIPNEVLKDIEPDPIINELKKKVEEKKKSIKEKYRTIKSAPEEDKIEYGRLYKDLNNAEKSFKADMTKAYQVAFRERLHNEELENQLRGENVEQTAEPVIQHHLEERTRLQTVLCDLTQNLSPTALTDRKVQAIDMMILLASRREIPQLSPPPPPSPPDKHNTGQIPSHSPELHPKDNKIPLRLNKAQCIYCIGNERLRHKDRTKIFRRVDNMRDHVDNKHFKFEDPTAKFSCHHPQCKVKGVFLNNMDHFKNHVEKVHGISLRKNKKCTERVGQQTRHKALPYYNNIIIFSKT